MCTRPPEILTPAEVKLILDACDPRYLTGTRNRAIFALLYRTGLRISEALALQVHDVNLEQGTVRVLHGKGDKARTVGVDEGALVLLRKWTDRRTQHLKQVNLAPRELFITRHGKPVPSANLRRKLKQLAHKVGITKRVHLHGFRHTHACELAQEGVQVNVIRRQLGHSSLAVTSRYLDHLHPTEVIDTIRARKWSA